VRVVGAESGIAGLEVATPRIVPLRASLLSVSQNRMVVKIGNKYVVFLKRKRSRIRFSIWGLDDDGRVVNYGVGELKDPAELSHFDIDDELRNVLLFCIVNWDFMQERRDAEILLKKNISNEPKVSDKEVFADEIASKVLEKRMVKTFYVVSGGKQVELGVYCYDESRGVYRDCEKDLEKEIEGFVVDTPELQHKTTKWIVDEAIAKVKRRTYEEFRYEKRKLVFYNKVFDWSRFIATDNIQESLMNPNPNSVILHWIPHKINIEKLLKVRQGLEKYIPPSNIDQLIEVFKALAPKSYRAFLSWVKYPGESEEEAKPRVAVLLEIIGYMLYPHEYPFHKAVLLVGEGSNGKSTFCRLLRTVLGDHNVSSVSLRDLDPRTNRFAATNLVNKLANISSEPVDSSRSFDPSLFKQLTSEDLVFVERKYKDPFEAVIFTKMVFSANVPPRVQEDTYAFWRRWLVIKFPNQFKPEPTFFERTFAEDEIGCIIISALYAFRLVLLRGSFTEQGALDPREEWLSRSSSIYRVVKAMIEDGLIELDQDGGL